MVASTTAAGVRVGALKHTTQSGIEAAAVDPKGMPGAAWALWIAALFAGAVHWLTADMDLDLRDEGFLWYGTVRAAAGEVPGADFQAYDPGRYYWGAAWSKLFGTGILALRLSTAIFQALGIYCGLLVARRAVRSGWILIPIGAVLTVWMFPRHKLFEPSLAMMAVFFAVRLFEQPSSRRHLVAGLFVGLAAIFGRNHGLYSGLGFALLILIAHWKRTEGKLLPDLAVWIGGIVLGFLPMLLMLAFHPAFAERFLESLLAMSDRGTNLPRPVPWPWTIDYQGLPPARYVSEFVLSGHYLLLACAYPLGLLWICFSKSDPLRQRAVVIASVCIGIPYVHHAVVRASASHLAQSIHPLLLGLFALPLAFGAWRRHVSGALVWVVLGGSALVVGWGVHPQLGRFGRRSKAALEAVSVAGDELRLPATQARGLANLQAVIAENVPADETLFVAPYRAAYYPLLGKVSPVWDIYMLWNATPEYQEGMIAALEASNVQWALLVKEFVSTGSGETFSETHRKVARYLARDFEPVRDARLPGDHFLMRRRPTK